MSLPPTFARHWPGGIPSCVVIHSDGERNEQEEIEDSRGWLLFVKEKWKTRKVEGISVDDTEYELRQRRPLIKRWASARQSFRDSYHSRAPLPKSGLDYPQNALDRITDIHLPIGSMFCLVPVDKDHPTNCKWWLRFQIMLYRLHGKYGHVLGPSESTVIVEQNPATPRPEGLNKTDLMSWQFLEPADFSSLSMTKSGEVRFLKGRFTNFLVDQHGLETGRLALLDFEPNGQIEVELLLRPFNMNAPMRHIQGLGWSVDRVKFENVGGFDWTNEPLKMDDPVLDILENALDLSEMVDIDGDRDQFAKDIELYAPGYLELEAAGRAAQYDVARLRSGEEAAEIWYRGLQEKSS